MALIEVARQAARTPEGSQTIQPGTEASSAATVTPERAIILLRATSRPKIRTQIAQRLDEDAMFVLLEHPDTPAEIREILVEKFLLVS